MSYTTLCDYCDLLPSVPISVVLPSFCLLQFALQNLLTNWNLFVLYQTMSTPTANSSSWVANQSSVVSLGHNAGIRGIENEQAGRRAYRLKSW